MKVKVNVYLKSGGNASTVVTCESIGELVTDYTRNMDSAVIVHKESNKNSVQIIPNDNVACINFEVVEE